ncbi:hypothetical protein FOMPIDRAFT_1044642 [Fomitopsis schrenkii]|uniref:DUF6533 domain-containing protein n=1 Tax=Fomitopsis schrenkii TaxID=2126942 RepID=S8FYQ0_FOMSC|nr:hypothetical protein FOMPIDRAFT_1044642 [Fomitopsis schrenkii]
MSELGLTTVAVLYDAQELWSCFAAVCSLYVYERIITLDEDIELVWRRRWSGVTVLYGALHLSVVALLMTTLAGYFVVSCARSVTDATTFGPSLRLCKRA